MVAEAAGSYCLANKMGRVFLLSLEDAMGRAALHVALNQAKLRHLINNYPPANLDLGWHFAEMSALFQAVQELHGERAGQSIALRAGRASFYRVQDDLAAVLGPSTRSLALLTPVARLRAGLRALAELDNQTGDQAVHLEETEGRFLFHVDRCPLCWGRTAVAPICHVEVGLLQETMHWVSGGQGIPVEEVQCIAQGDPSCCYAVEKHRLV